MLKFFRRLRGRSLSEVRFRGTQALTVFAERLRLRISPQHGYQVGHIGPDELLSGVSLTLSMLGGRTQEPEAIVKALIDTDSNALNLLRSRSRQLHAGWLQILGLPDVAIGSIPNWHCDATTGLITPKVHWSRIPYLDSTVVGDHKSLWEVNRHQYLFAPAMTWLADGADDDFQLVQRHLSSWLDENPPSVGINWASSLEVAYRAITWCWLLWLLNKAPWDRAVLKRLGVALERSGLHIERYLSVYFSPNTHLTGEALSLFYLGSLLPRSPHAGRWRSKGAAILESWVDRQVHPDGVYREQAALYHRYTAEIYLHYLCVARASKRSVSSDVIRHIHGLFDVLRSMASAGAELPLIGDDDGGQLLPLDQRMPEYVAGVLLAGATALSRPDLVPAGAICPTISYALCGVENTGTLLQGALQCCVPAWRDRYFPDGGIAVLRDDWSSTSAVAVIDAGPHGVLNCGHAHADALSMTLALGPVPILIDRGTATYVGAERNEYRATSSHNTLEFDGESSVTPGGPFQWGQVPWRPVGQMRVYDEVTLFSALAPGHADSARPSLHRRVVAHVPNGVWVVLDQAERPGLQRAMVRWQLAPGLVATRCESVFNIQDATGRPLAEVAVLGAKSLTQSVREVSLRYGHKAPATVIEIVAGSEGRVTTVILPTNGLLPLARMAARLVSGAALCEWADVSGSHQLWAPDASRVPFLAPQGVSAAAQALWLRAPLPWTTNGPVVADLIVALGATELIAAGTEVFVAETPDNAGSDVVVGSSAIGWTILSETTPANTVELP